MTEIKKGDEFLCIKDFRMDSGEIRFTKGKVYNSEKDSCLTNDKGNDNHIMDTYKKFNKFFIKQQKQIKKEDLKTRTIVQFANGMISLLIDGYFIDKSGYIYLNDIDENLNCKADSNFNIIKASKQLTGDDLTPSNWTSETINANLLWERQEVVNEMTIEELEKLTGLTNLKIKK